MKIHYLWYKWAIFNRYGTSDGFKKSHQDMGNLRFSIDRMVNRLFENRYMVNQNYFR